MELSTTTVEPEILEYVENASIVLIDTPYVYSTTKTELFTANELSFIVRDQKRVNLVLAGRHKDTELLKEYLIENYEEIGEAHAVAIAEIMEIDLTTEHEVTLNLSITATLTLPMGKTPDDYSTYDFDVELSANDSEIEIQYFDSNIDSMDY